MYRGRYLREGGVGNGGEYVNEPPAGVGQAAASTGPSPGVGYLARLSDVTDRLGARSRGGRPEGANAGRGQPPVDGSALAHEPCGPRPAGPQQVAHRAAPRLWPPVSATPAGNSLPTAGPSTSRPMPRAAPQRTQDQIGTNDHRRDPIATARILGPGRDPGRAHPDKRHPLAFALYLLRTVTPGVAKANHAGDDSHAAQQRHQNAAALIRIGDLLGQSGESSTRQDHLDTEIGQNVLEPLSRAPEPATQYTRSSTIVYPSGASRSRRSSGHESAGSSSIRSAGSTRTDRGPPSTRAR